VGDAVMTLPATRALAAAFPGRLTVLTRPWAMDIYRRQDGVDDVLPHDRGGQHRGLAGRWQLARGLAARDFDLAVLFQNAFEAAFIAALARVPQRWGYARDGRSPLLTKAVPLQPGDRYIHESFYYLQLLERAGLAAPFTRPCLTPKPEDFAVAEALLAKAGVRPGEFLLAVAPGAAFGSAKRWPAENFSRAADYILGEIPGRAMILGGPGEKEAAARVAEGLGSRAINLAGAGTLSVSMALMRRAKLLLTNDSGLMHVGGALDIPLVAMFGPTNPLTTAPLGPSRLLRSAAPCAPCLKRECPLPRQMCFDDVTPERARAAALDLLATRARPGTSPGVFLDRDGTVNEEVEYLKSPEELRLIPGSAEAIAALNRAGFKVVLVTNQSGLARGLFSAEDLEHIHQRLRELLAAKGARLDGVYFCPHHPEGTVPEYSRDCDCRKPATGLFEKACRDLAIDPARSFWVGDRRRDLEAADTMGGRSALVLTGYGLREVQKPGWSPTLVAPDLRRAAEWILSFAEPGEC
jgi:heptosyltransferase-2